MHVTRREIEADLATHHTAAYGWALTCCAGDEAEAEDVVQEAYLRLLGGRARFEGRSEFRTFVFGVVRRVASERARRVARRRGLLKLFRRDVPHAAPSTTARRHDQASDVRKALTQISPRQRELLHLVFYEDLTIEKAAEVIGVSVGTARTHYERGKARLRELLADSQTAPATASHRRPYGASI